MKKIIAQRFTRKGHQFTIVILLVVLISSCSSSNNVLSRRSFNKRKYNSGHFISKGNIPQSKKKQQIAIEFTEVNTLERKKLKTIDSDAIATIVKTDIPKKKEDFKIELNPQHVQREKINTLPGDFSKNENIPVEKVSYPKVKSASEEASNSNERVKKSKKQSYGYSSVETKDIFLITLGIAVLFGILALVVIEGTVLFYASLVVAGIAAGIAGACLLIMPLEWLIDAIFPSSFSRSRFG